MGCPWHRISSADIEVGWVEADRSCWHVCSQTTQPFRPRTDSELQQDFSQFLLCYAVDCSISTAFFGSFWDYYSHISQMKLQSSSRFLGDVCLFCSTVISEPANHLHSKTAMSSLENTNSLNERLKNTMSLYTSLLIWGWFLGKSYMDGIVIQGFGSARQRLTKRSRRPLQLLRCGEMGGFTSISRHSTPREGYGRSAGHCPAETQLGWVLSKQTNLVV